MIVEQWVLVVVRRDSMDKNNSTSHRRDDESLWIAILVLALIIRKYRTNLHCSSTYRTTVYCISSKMADTRDFFFSSKDSYLLLIVLVEMENA